MNIKNKAIWIITILLIFIEQGIKIIIYNNYMNNSFPIMKPWLYFEPMFNVDYSWINSMLQLGVGKYVHIFIVLVMIAFILIFYKFLSSHVENTLLIDTTFGFIIAGAFCSLIDKVFWNGSLDFIYVKGFFTFDLKDVYINVFIGLVILMCIFNYKGLRKVDDGEVMKAFFKFIKGGEK